MSKTFSQSRIFVSIVAFLTIFSMSGATGLVFWANAALPLLSPALPISLAWSDKDQVENTLTVPSSGASCQVVAHMDLLGNTGEEAIQSLRVSVSPELAFSVSDLGMIDPSTQEVVPAFVLSTVENLQGLEDGLLWNQAAEPYVFSAQRWDYTLNPGGVVTIPNGMTPTRYYLSACVASTATIGTQFTISFIGRALIVNNGTSGLVPFSNAVVGPPDVVSSGVITLVEDSGGPLPLSLTDINVFPPVSATEATAESIVELATLALSGVGGTDALTAMSVSFTGVSNFNFDNDIQPFTQGPLAGRPIVFLANQALDPTTNESDLQALFEQGVIALLDSGSSTPLVNGGSIRTLGLPGVASPHPSIVAAPSISAYYLYALMSGAATENGQFAVVLNSFTSEGLGIITKNVALDPVTILAGGGGPGPGSEFVLLGYGPSMNSTVPVFAPVDYFFSLDFSDAVNDNPENYFSISPAIDGEWTIYDEYWGDNHIYRASFFPQDGWANGQSYNVKVAKNLTAFDASSFTVNLGLTGDNFTELNSDNDYYWFTISGGSQTDSGYFPPIAIGGYPASEMRNVPTSLTQINVEFDRNSMDAATFTANNVFLSKITNDVASVVQGVSVTPTSGESRTVSLSGFSLETNSHYMITVTRDVKDLQGNRLLGQFNGGNAPGNYTSHFYTGGSSASITASYVGMNINEYKNTVGERVNVPVSEILRVSYSNALTSAISNANVSLSPSLNCAGPNGDFSVLYDANAYEIIVAPNCPFAGETLYALTIQSLTSVSGSPVATINKSFTTGVADLTKPAVRSVVADNFGLIVEFSENMNTTLIQNKGKYTLKLRNDLTAWDSVTPTSLSSAIVKYQADKRTTFIDLNLTPNYEYQLSVSTDLTDLSANTLYDTSAANVFTGYVMDASKFAGGNGNKGMANVVLNMTSMGANPVSAMPMSKLAGATTKYFINFPITQQIPAGGTIEFVFPQSFNVANVRQDSESPANADMNGSGPNRVSFAGTDPSNTTSNGVDNDGLGVIGDRTVVVKTNAATGTLDKMHIDLSNIINSSSVKKEDTGGWQVEIRTKNAQGQLLEGLLTMPFFTSAGGNITYTVNIDGVDSGDSGTVKVELKSPMTGALSKEVSVTGVPGADGTVQFFNLEAGQYELRLNPNIVLNGHNYLSNSQGQMVTVSDILTNKTLTISNPSQAGNVYPLVVNLIGDFTTGGQNDSVDIFAGNSSNFRVVSVTPGNTAGTPQTIYLTDGTWDIGIGPTLTTTGAPNVDWPVLPHQKVKIWNSGQNASVNNITFDASDLESFVVSGSVVDTASVGIGGVEVYAYRPNEALEKQRTTTNADGTFQLRINWGGIYTIGVFKPGFPESSLMSLEVLDDVSGVVLQLKKPDYTISGMVKDLNGNGVANAPISAHKEDGTKGWVNTLTSATGNYILYVSAGNWRVETNAPKVGWMQYPNVVAVTSASVNGINISPDSDYYTISGNVTLDSVAYSFSPIRAVQYTNGQPTGKQYNGQTDGAGNYSITAPGGINYRIDIWAPGYGEIERTDSDDVPNSPANVTLNSDKEGVDILVGSDDLFDVSINFNNANEQSYDNVRGYINLKAINIVTKIPTGYENNMLIQDVSDISTSNAIKVREGNYLVSVHVDGIGEVVPQEVKFTSPTTPGYLDVGGTSLDENTLTVNLPETSSLITVTGTVRDAVAAPIQNAWVTVNNSQNGFNSGVSTGSNGTFSIKVPTLSSGNYSIAVGKPGYMATVPVAVNLTDANNNQIADTTYSLVLTAQTATISGYIYADNDGGTNDVYDAGEGLSFGWVFAQESTTGVVSNAQVDANGAYTLGVVNGTWTLYGNADSYQKTQYNISGTPATIAVSGSSLTGKNIELALRSGWTKASAQNPVTLNRGGTFDPINGLKVGIPANALGTDSTAGSLNATNTTAVVTTPSSRPFGMQGKTITAVDENGQAITTLNDYVDLQLVLFKSDVDDELDSGRMTDLTDLLSSQLGYFDETTQNWVNLDTVRSVYYLDNEGDEEWKLYQEQSANETPFEHFVNEVLIGGNETFYNYKLVFDAKVSHFTTFGITTALGVAAAEAPAESPDVAPRSSAGGGAPSIVLVTEITIDKPTNVSLSTNNSNIILKKDGAMNFMSSGLAHTLTLQNVDVTGQSVTLTIASEPFNVNIGLNKVAQVDINNDGVSDLEITLSAINSTSEVKLTVRQLSGASVLVPGIVEETLVPIETSPVVTTDEAPTVVGSYLPRKASIIDLDAENVALTDFVALTKTQPKTQVDTWVVDYLAYGNSVQTTKLTARERKGLLNDFASIYGNLPKTESDWKALADIADGKLTPKRVLAQEVTAIKEFYKIFKKAINFKDKTNELFVHKLAYRMRSNERDLSKEQTALSTFVKVYKKTPWNGYAWSIVRALAYSGILDK